MKKIITAILTSCISLSLTTSVFATSHVNKQEVVNLPKDQIVNSDYFAWGEKVTISGTVNGDAYVAGGNVLVDGTINGDLLVAGGSVIIRGAVTNDVRVAGGQVTISGQVEGNATAIGGSVSITDSAKINGSLVTGSGDISVFGPIGEGATIGAGNATIGNSIGSDITAGVGELTLTQTAKVNGNLTYWSDRDAQIQQGAQVAGSTTKNTPAPKRDERKDILTGAKLTWAFLSVVSAFIIGFLFLKFLPLFTENTAKIVRDRPWYSLLIGLLTVIVVPIAAILLLITIIGVPFAVFLFFSWMVLLYISKIFVAYAVGQKILKSFDQRGGVLIALIVGLVLYAVLSFIPIIGWIVTLVVILIGTGALVLGKLQMYKSLKTKKLI